MFEGPTPRCSQSSFSQSVVPFGFPGGWCVVGDVIHPLKAEFFSPGVREVVWEMSPAV